MRQYLECFERRMVSGTFLITTAFPAVTTLHRTVIRQSHGEGELDEL